MIYQLALSKSYLESYYNGTTYNTDTLYDFRIINLGCVRRSGATSAVAELFDVEKDVYVAKTKFIVDEFNNKLYELGKTMTRKSSIKYLLIGDTDFTSIRGRSLCTDSNIWFDLGYSITKSDEILQKIRYIDSMYHQHKLTYIIL